MIASDFGPAVPDDGPSGLCYQGYADKDVDARVMARVARAALLWRLGSFLLSVVWFFWDPVSYRSRNSRPWHAEGATLITALIAALATGLIALIAGLWGYRA